MFIGTEHVAAAAVDGAERRERDKGKKGKEVVLQEEHIKEADDVEEAMRQLVISDKSLEPEAIMDGMGQLAVQDDDGDADQATLAMERGDRAPHPQLVDVGRVGVNIFEKRFSSPEAAGGVQAPSLRPEDLYGGSIEGFEPRRQLGKARQEDDEEDDDDILATI
ncbi:hypothetical protein ACJ72_01441 [Emergomyces africanus]|uniref:Uncharacterized protein n=1 Tax=Emergomyces africanus TaxID=1955775 RepID=A0A1B7P598_9EURO|nr:hypothetical protein ACJ72_01441 [Emergomyces africanus]